MIVNKVRQYQRANLNLNQHQNDVELYILKHYADSYTIHSSHTHRHHPPKAAYSLVSMTTKRKTAFQVVRWAKLMLGRFPAHQKTKKARRAKIHSETS